MSENRCVSCGEIIPEGGQVCPVCMAKAIKQQERIDRTEEIMFDWVYPLILLALIVLGIVYVVGVG
jgi:predicted nucleic acid-binding Zn ribbon protein